MCTLLLCICRRYINGANPHRQTPTECQIKPYANCLGILICRSDNEIGPVIRVSMVPLLFFPMDRLQCLFTWIFTSTCFFIWFTWLNYCRMHHLLNCCNEFIKIYKIFEWIQYQWKEIWNDYIEKLLKTIKKKIFRSC